MTQQSRTQALVSVIIPAYQSADSLGQAVATVLAQTYAKLEVLIIIDGNDQATKQLAKRLNKQDSRVRIVAGSAQPAGPAAARNRGLRAARGELMAFLDDDDGWLPQKLAQQLEELRRHGCDLVYTDAVVRHADGRADFRYSQHHAMHAGKVMHELIAENFVMTSTVLFTRTFQRKVGFMKEDLKAAEDYEFWLRFAAEGARFGAVSEPLVNYYVGEGNISNQQERMLRGLVGALESVAARYPKYQAVIEPRLRQAREALSYYLVTQSHRRDLSRARRRQFKQLALNSNQPSVVYKQLARAAAKKILRRQNG